MNTATKKPSTPAPRMNVLKDQLKEQRFGLITKVKALREQRQALKGVKGSGQQWGELCAQIDELQAKIDMLSKSLGLPVKDRKEAMSGNKLAQSIAEKPQYHQKHSPDGRVDLVGQRRGHVDVVAAETSATASKLA